MSADTTAQATAPAARTKPFLWSVRRELWENPAIFLGPLAVAGFALFAFLISTARLPQAVRRIAQTAQGAAGHPGDLEAVKAASRARHALELPYDLVAAIVCATAIVVAVFYALGALHNERRDRSILFWKSLPVSDLTTVLAKAAVPLAIVPATIFAVIFATHLVMLAWSALVLSINGLPVSALIEVLPFPFMWPALARGLVILALWWAPVIAWLMLVSAWARRTPIVWAVVPWLVICLIERVAFNAGPVAKMLAQRLAGGPIQAFTVDGLGQGPIHQMSDLDPSAVIANSGLWIGLGVAAALLAGAIRLRRYRDPI